MKLIPAPNTTIEPASEVAYASTGAMLFGRMWWKMIWKVAGPARAGRLHEGLLAEDRDDLGGHPGQWAGSARW